MPTLISLAAPLTTPYLHGYARLGGATCPLDPRRRVEHHRPCGLLELRVELRVDMAIGRADQREADTIRLHVGAA